MNSGDDLLDKIQKAKQEYYSENQKNIVFKNKQKIECASHIVKQIDPNLVYAQILSIQENRIVFNFRFNWRMINSLVFLGTSESPKEHG
jgi:hypothetical protein